MRIRLAAAAAVGGLLLAACGDDTSPTPQEAAAVRTLVDAELSDGEEACLVRGLEDLGVLADAVTGGGLTPEQDTEVLAITLDCVQDLGAIPSFVAAFIEGAADEGVILTEAQARCAIDTADEADAAAAIAACLDQSPDAAGGDYGDDPVFDLLWESCENGNNQACDELYLTSPLGSAYEEFARTCGGRLPDSLGARCFDDLG